ncbi:MAG: hypothetical protein GXP19_04385 [Gammaproteobacteria bacterium]|nr:hypothetical protein [Gammaproteobacteria bacterium]
MNYRRISQHTVLIISSLLVASCLLPLQQTKWKSLDQQAARETFMAYKYALLNNLGKEAADLISEKTIQHYAHLRSLALAGNLEELNALSAYNKLVVLNMRHTISGKMLKTMSAKDIFAYGVEQEWIAKEDIAPYDIGTISVYGAYASAELQRGAKNTDTILEFLNENEVWRINLLPILKKAGQNFTAQIPTADEKNENDMILKIIESMSGRKTTKAIWEPILNVKPLISDSATKKRPAKTELDKN